MPAQLASIVDRARAGPRRTSAAPLVIVLDPDDDSRDMYGLYLQQRGFRVLGTLDAAGDRARPATRVLLLKDADEESGACRRVLDRECSRGASLIALTARPDAHIAQRTPNCRCTLVLMKPVLPGDLAAHVQRLASGRHD